MSRPWTLIRSQYAIAARRGDPPEVLRELRAELRAARAEDYLRTVLGEDPPITLQRRRELANLLLSGGEADAA